MLFRHVAVPVGGCDEHLGELLAKQCDVVLVDLDDLPHRLGKKQPLVVGAEGMDLLRRETGKKQPLVVGAEGINLSKKSQALVILISTDYGSSTWTISKHYICEWRIKRLNI